MRLLPPFRGEGALKISIAFTALSALLLIGAGPESVGTKDCTNCPLMLPLTLRLTEKQRINLLVGQYEVSWKEYLESVKLHGCPLPKVNTKDGPATFSGNLTDVADDYPVTGIDQTGVKCYLDWLSKVSKKAYRLPTGDEWTAFASAGRRMRFPWGDELGFNNAVIYMAFDRSACPTMSVDDPRFGSSYRRGCFAPNAFGLYDLIGNVAEATDGPNALISASDGPAERHLFYEIRGGNSINYPDLSINRVWWEYRQGYSSGLRVVAEMKAN